MSEPLQPTETTKPPKACQLHGVPEPQTSQQPEPSQVPGSDAQLTKYPPQPEPSSTQNRQPSFHFNPEPPREATRLPKRLCRKFMITFPYATVGLTSTFQAVLKVTWERGSRSYGPFDRVDEIIQQGDNLKHRYHFLIADVVRFPHVGTYSWHVKVFDSSLCTYRAGCDDFDRLDASWEEQCPWKTVVHEDGLGLEPGYDLKGDQHKKTRDLLERVTNLAWVQRREREKGEREVEKQREKDRRGNAGRGRGVKRGRGRGHRARGSVSS